MVTEIRHVVCYVVESSMGETQKEMMHRCMKLTWGRCNPANVDEELTKRLSGFYENT